MPSRERLGRLDSLIREAWESAKWRGHEMTGFQRLAKFGQATETFARSHCRNCHMDVEVNTRSLPQQMEITGQAVSIACPHKEDH